MIAFESAFPCLLSAQLFKVQVNLSWWLAVWSQEVASVREGRGGGGLSYKEWSVVVVEEFNIRGKDTKRQRSQ